MIWPGLSSLSIISLGNSSLLICTEVSLELIDLCATWLENFFPPLLELIHLCNIFDLSPKTQLRVLLALCANF